MKPFTPARETFCYCCGMHSLGLVRRWDREGARRRKRSTLDRRTISNRYKLEQRGTYQRRDHWRLELCARRVQEAERVFMDAIESEP